MPMPERTLVQAVRDALFEEMERDDRVCVLGQDVGLKGGVFKATEGLQQRFGAQRVMDMPLAESSIAAVAQGLALEGFKPVAEMQFADYSYPAFNQIVNEIAKVRYRSNGDFSCPLVIRAPTGGGVRGALYHSQSPETFYCHVPGLKVVLPSTPADAKGLLKAAIRDPDPIIFFEPKKLYRAERQDLAQGEAALLPLGAAAVVRQGAHLTVVTYGYMRAVTMQAAARLSPDGIEVEIIDLRTLRPWDVETCVRSIEWRSSTRPTGPADSAPRLRLSSLSAALPAWMPRSAASPVRTSRQCRLAPVSNTRSCSIRTRWRTAYGASPVTERWFDMKSR
jgi:pyruvate/2-oxoglutarate/acetoin dehydrogenase E1 component